MAIAAWPRDKVKRFRPGKIDARAVARRTGRAGYRAIRRLGVPLVRRLARSRLREHRCSAVSVCLGANHVVSWAACLLAAKSRLAKIWLGTGKMVFSSSHFGLHVRDLASARAFYVDQLGLSILQDSPAMNMFAVRAGGVRLSIFGDRTDAGRENPSQIILATDDLSAAIADLEARGLRAIAPPAEAPGFMKFVHVIDPDGNRVGIVQYLRDPLAPI